MHISMHITLGYCGYIYIRCTVHLTLKHLSFVCHLIHTGITTSCDVSHHANYVFAIYNYVFAIAKLCVCKCYVFSNIRKLLIIGHTMYKQLGFRQYNFMVKCHKVYFTKYYFTLCGVPCSVHITILNLHYRDGVTIPFR